MSGITAPFIFSLTDNHGHSGKRRDGRVKSEVSDCPLLAERGFHQHFYFDTLLMENMFL